MYLAQVVEEGTIQLQLQRERDAADMLRFEEHQRAREYSQKQYQDKIDREIMTMVCTECLLAPNYWREERSDVMRRRRLFREEGTTINTQDRPS